MWILAVIALVLIVAGLVAWRLRSGGSRTAAEMPPPVALGAEPAPMSDLEAALDAVADSSGRSMRDEIEAQSEQVDRLRDDDDTGPLLRRALDSVTDAADGESLDGADEPKR